MKRFAHNGLLAEFEKRIHDRIETETNTIAKGQCKDWSDYLVRVERRKTLVIVLEDLDDSLKTYLREDDDE